MKKKNVNKKQLNKFLRFSGIGLQMGLTIYLSSELGKWLDSKYINQHQMYTKICAIVGIFASIYSVIRQVTNLSKND